MTFKNMGIDLKFTSPASYRIGVKGFLDESWSDRLSGMNIHNEVSGRTTPIAFIEGQVRDQSELFGVLNSLYEMHLPMLSLELLNGSDNNRH